MTFSTLAGSVGGGQQTPGFMGCGKVYIASRKFLSAEGGHRRIVWMPQELKETLREDLSCHRRAAGRRRTSSTRSPTRRSATDADAVRAFMEKVGHPALALWDITRHRRKPRRRIASASSAEAATPPAPAAARQADAEAVQPRRSRRS